MRLSTVIDPKDAHAIDVKYHLNCWMKNVEHVLSRSTKPSKEDEERPQGDSTEHQKYVLDEIEFFSMLGEALQEGSFLELDIQSPDTDVLVLCVRRFPSLIPDTNFVTGTGISRRFISVASIYNILGEREMQLHFLHFTHSLCRL